jgi:hypothetical protein
MLHLESVEGKEWEGVGVVRYFCAALGVTSIQLGLEADTVRGGSVIKLCTPEGIFQTGIPVNRSDDDVPLSRTR